MNIQLLTNPHVFTHLLASQYLRNRDVAALCFPFPRTWHFSLDTFCLFNCDGYQYETKPQAQGGRGYAELLFFPTAEGYVKTLYKDDLNEQEPADFQYIYIYKDHLGNNRLSYTLDPQTEQVKILEENHYYPFGLKHGNYNNTKKEVKYKEELAEKKEVKQVMEDKVAFKYKYNGKELQDELGLNVYDYGARIYEPAAPHFWQIDPLAEKYHTQSPYVYADDNPVLFVDINGEGVDSTIVVENKDGTYTVTGGDLTDGDKGIYIDDGNGGKGKKIGESLTMFSFYNEDAQDGEGQTGWKGTIDPNSTESGGLVSDFINKVDNDEVGLVEYAKNATDGKDYDFKRDGDPKNEDRNFHHRGSKFAVSKNGTQIYATARDAGNFAAGYISFKKNLSWFLAKSGFNLLEFKNSLTSGKLVFSEGRQSGLAQQEGYIYAFFSGKRSNYILNEKKKSH